MTIEGTKETKEFYDNIGWKRQHGESIDSHLFGSKEDGPIRKRMFNRKWDRIASHISQNQIGPQVLEVGCGGSPERMLLQQFETYKGVDFSQEGLEMARKKWDQFGERVEFVEADAVSLPFADATFDAVYSAHMLYHIEDRRAQTVALNEMLRVLKPFGSLVISTANPRPLLFPKRLLTRLVADTPVVNRLARRLKGKSPLPYNPARLSWYKNRLSGQHKFEIINGGIASTSFNQSVSEYKNPGKRIWSLFNALDRLFPRGSAHLGNYAVILVHKK